MSDSKTQKIKGAQPPVEHTGLELTEPKTVAAGMGALKSSLEQIMSEMSLAKGWEVLKEMNQKDGFDCPGCAWPDPDDKRSVLGEYCENGVKAIVEEATDKRADPFFFKKHSVEELKEKSDYWIGKAGRITNPMFLDEGATHYTPISWEKAFSIIAEELNALSSPNQAIFYTSGRTSNEAAFLYQLFVREFGTNNLPDCSNMCHESSGVALSETLGIGKGSVTLEDFEHADLVMVIGQNPGTNHPRMLTALADCKKNGGKIISINPLPETGLIGFSHPQKPLEILKGGTKLTDLFLQVKINGDVALLKAIMKTMLDEEEKNPGTVFDLEFIKSQTNNYEAFIAELKKVSVEEMAAICGISVEQIQEAAQLIMQNKNIIICWAMGLTQHKNGVANIQEVVNLLLLKGSIGKKGAGTCPVRGHSNVQGDRTMGIWEKPKPDFLNKLKEVFGFEPPKEHGVDVVEAIHYMLDGKAKVFFAMGGNFLSATPDTELTAKAMQNCSLTVHVSTKPNRSHVIHGKRALILPCLSRSEKDEQASGEQFVSVENSMGVVHSSKGKLTPASPHLKSEPAIVCELAKVVLKDKTKIKWDEFEQNYDNIRNKIEAVIPGFDNYNKRVRIPGGFYLPNNAREADFTKTSTGKANFTIHPVQKTELKEDEFLMMTIRTHDQYNTTIYGLDDRYRGILNERRVVLMNKNDIRKHNLYLKARVDLSSHFENIERIAEDFFVIPYDIPEQCVATYFPEANVLVPLNQTAEKSNTPASKSVIIKIKKRPL